MTSPLQSRRLPVLVLGLSVAGLAAAACGIPTGQAGAASSGPDPLRCELVLDTAGGATTIQGRVDADRPVSGSYRLSITSSAAGGGARIEQSGDFEARPGAPAILGETRLGGSPAQYRAELELSLPDRRLSCSGRSGAREL